MLVLEAQLAEIREGDGLAQLVIVFAAVQCQLDIATQRRLVDKTEQIQAANDVVIFPQGCSGLVFARIGTELARDDALRGGLQRQRHYDPLNPIPIIDDELFPELAHRFEEPVIAVRMLEAVERCCDRSRDVLVARGKLVAEHVQDSEVDFIGAVGVRRMNVRLHLGGVVEQDIKHVMAFVLVRPDDPGVYGDMVGNQCVGDHAFFQTKIFRRVAGVDGGQASFEFLAVGAGMYDVANIVFPENGQLSDGVGDQIISFSEGFQPDEVVRCRRQHIVADVGNLPHPAEPRIGAPGQNTRGNRPLICFGFNVAAERMLKDVHESALLVHEIQDAADTHLPEIIENGMVGLVFVSGVFQAPARFAALFLDLDILVLASSDPLVDCCNLAFKLTFKGGQMFFDWQFEGRESGTFNEFLFVAAPCLVVDQILLEAAKPDAVTAVDVASFQPVTQQTADVKFISVGNDPLMFALFANIKITIDVAGDETRPKYKVAVIRGNISVF